jgi:hypothetical protein
MLLFCSNVEAKRFCPLFKYMITSKIYILYFCDATYRCICLVYECIGDSRRIVIKKAYWKWKWF